MRNYMMGMHTTFILILTLSQVRCKTVISNIKSFMCDDPWVELINGKFYLIGNQVVSNLEASEYCERKGGVLTEISSKKDYQHILRELVSQSSGSVWVSENARPEYFTQTWRDMYAAGEPNHSGSCLYLSRTYKYLWRDTACSRRKLPLCQYLGDSHPCNKDGGVRRSHSCTTDKGERCALPFTYNGQTFHQCTKKFDLNDKLWCSTNTDEFGVHNGEKNWGYCGPTC